MPDELSPAISPPPFRHHDAADSIFAALRHERRLRDASRLIIFITPWLI